MVSGTAVGSDPDGDLATYSATQGTKGTVAIDPNTGAWTYSPTAAARHDAAATGASAATRTDTFTITVSDGPGGIATQTVSVDLTPQLNSEFGWGDSGGPDQSRIAASDVSDDGRYRLHRRALHNDRRQRHTADQRHHNQSSAHHRSARQFGTADRDRGRKDGLPHQLHLHVYAVDTETGDITTIPIDGPTALQQHSAATERGSYVTNQTNSQAPAASR